MDNKIKNLIVLVLVIVLLGFGIFIWKDFIWSKNEVLVLNQSWSIVNQEGTYIKSLQEIADAWELDETLKLLEQQESYTIDDYLLFMWVYIDLWDYKKVLEYWDLAYKQLSSIKEQSSEESSEYWNNELNIDDYMIQAYLYLWDLENAKKYLDRYEEDNQNLIFSRAFYKYKSWDYKGVVDFKNTINQAEESSVWFSLDFLAKSYIKLWDTSKAIDIYEDLYFLSNKIKNYDSDGEILNVYYWYLASLKLKDLYPQENDTSKAKKYQTELDKFESIIDEWKIVNTKIAYFVLNRQNDL
jgi:hypothetical protein